MTRVVAGSRAPAQSRCVCASAWPDGTSVPRGVSRETTHACRSSGSRTTLRSSLLARGLPEWHRAVRSQSFAYLGKLLLPSCARHEVDALSENLTTDGPV